MALLLLLEQREEPGEVAREVLLDVGRDDPPHVEARLHRLHAVVEARQRHHDDGARVAELLLELALRVGGVQRDDDAAGLPDPELCDDELRAVGEHEGDAIALPDAVGRERGRERVAGAFELAEADPGALEEQCGMVGPLTRRRRDDVEQRAAGVGVEGCGHALVVVRQPRPTDHPACLFARWFCERGFTLSHRGRHAPPAVGS
jgi:hypothetical protein